MNEQSEELYQCRYCDLCVRFGEPHRCSTGRVVGFNPYYFRPRVPISAEEEERRPMTHGDTSGGF